MPSDPTTGTPPPVEPTPGSNTPSDSLDINDLAELYVRQYEEGSGVTLSDEAFQAKKTDVANFYSSLNNGEDRLDTVVFANDGPSETIA